MNHYEMMLARLAKAPRPLGQKKRKKQDFSGKSIERLRRIEKKERKPLTSKEKFIEMTEDEVKENLNIGILK